ncbi:MAG: GGDEF domain-containing protein [Pseudomonadota bacterium]
MSVVDYAFQPIVNIHTGNAFGFEALLRNHDKAGFPTIDALFDQAWADGVLHQVDLVLREKALEKFSLFKCNHHVKLFFNLDNRLFHSQDYSPGNTVTILKRLGYSQDDICFEISEKHQLCHNDDVSNILATYRSQGFKMAIDDCGAGFSGLQLLYYAEPDYIKIDRFFIQNLEKDSRKRLLVSTIVDLAHSMGCLVMAEGVESKEEFFTCKEIGCDMVQGYFVQFPQTDLSAMKKVYQDICHLSQSDKRRPLARDRALIRSQISYIKPVYADCDIITIFDAFRKELEYPFFPVLNRHDEPIGIVRDNAFKDVIFSKYGRQLLENPAFGKSLDRFLTKIPIADIHSSIEKLIEQYAQDNTNEGLLIVDNMKYIGFLTPQALLKMINEKNLAIARSQNPLSRLPGNTLIHEYISRALSDTNTPYCLIYFDFDNFKVFNDTYGFRNGDRLILMFADLLKAASQSENRFAGHVGGDDFFLGVRDCVREIVAEEMIAMAKVFRKNAESFYDKTAITNGYIQARDRDGKDREIPLVTVSTAILELPEFMERSCSIERAGNIMAILKKEAKKSESGISVSTIERFLSPPYQAPHLSLLVNE